METAGREKSSRCKVQRGGSGRFAHSWRKVAGGGVGAGEKKYGLEKWADRKRVLMNASVDQTHVNRNR